MEGKKNGTIQLDKNQARIKGAPATSFEVV